MNVSLYQVLSAVESLGADSTRIKNAVAELSCLLSELDEVEVKGRDKVDTLLGCMMAIEAIIGEDKPNV